MPWRGYREGDRQRSRDPGTTRRSVRQWRHGAGLIPEESVNSKLRREIKPTTTY